MKAGIYETPNGNLIYVAKDRTIKAASLKPSSWLGTKVSHRSADDTVLIEGTHYRCKRVSDVPNGCTDPEKALFDYVNTLVAAEQAAEAVKAKFSAAGDRYLDARFAPGEVRYFVLDDRGLLTDDVERRRELEHQGFRLCHAQSARKHRKRGHTVVPLWGNKYAWRPADYLHPYQRDALARFVSDERITIKAPVSIGKSEAGAL